MSGHFPTGDPTPPPSEDNKTIVNMVPLTIPYEMRNAEAVHNAMLQESKSFHDNLRKEAENFLQNHLLVERLKAVKLEGEQKEAKAKLERDILLQQKKIQDAETSLLLAEAEKKEADRKKREAEIRAREAENAIKLMPKVPPRAATPPHAPATSAVNPATAAQQIPPKSSTETSTNQPTIQALPVSQAHAPPATQPAPHNPFAQAKPPTSQSPFAQGQNAPVQQTPPSISSNALAPAAQPTPNSTNSHQPVTNAPQPSAGTLVQTGTSLSDMVDQPETQRYIDIHLQLKILRNQVKPKGKQNTSPLKAEAMKQSAALRIAIGQLSTGNKNAPIFIRLRQIMLESLSYQVNVGNGPEVLFIDPTPYVLHVPQPQSDPAIKNNGTQLPVLFIYLLSVFAKVLVAQAAQEAAQKSEAAEPIALAAHQIFSHPDLLWRGMSLIDILVAKLRKSCGTLFGFRGTESKETGRVTLGWKKEDGVWISESFHYDRMRGIGAFYAGLTLRIYKNRVNPYPPHHYWRAMAAILSCPQQERSNTSYYVLCALIQGYEQKFLQFYGNMARCALEAALVHYPRGAREKNSAVMTLLTLGEKIEKDGLSLAQW